MYYSKRGFTILELLVVIAIMGILAAIILASVAKARQKSLDAQIQEQFHSLRNEGEIYNTTNNTYNPNSPYGLQQCNSTVDGFFSDPAFGGKAIVDSILAITGVDPAQFECANNGVSWMAIVNLPSNPSPNSYWCVDSTGNLKGEADETIGSGVTDTGILTNGVDQYICK